MKLRKNVRKILVVAGLALLTGLAPRPAPAKIRVEQLGRQVNVPATPRRLVTLAASLTEIVFDLGMGNRLVGVAQFSDYPPAAQKLPKVGSYIAPDLEKIVALRPDLCLAIKDGNPRQVVDRLQSLGIPVYVVDPRNLPEMIATLKAIGHLLGAGPRADALAAALTRRYQRIKGLAASARHRPRVFLQIGLAPIVSAGSHTFLNELITTAGGVNLAGGKTPYPRFSIEEVLARQPQVIIITSMARGGAFAQVKANWESWRNIPAARSHRIFLVDSDLVDRPSPRLLDGLELLFRLLHPKLAEKLP